MLLHVTLLTVQTAVVIINTLPHGLLANFYYKLQIVLVSVDTIV